MNILESCVELDTQCLENPVNAYINYKLKALKRKERYADASISANIALEVRKRAENTIL